MSTSVFGIKTQDSNRTPETPQRSQAQERTSHFSDILRHLTAQQKEAPSLSQEERIQQAVQEAAQKYNLPPALICAVMKQESGFNPRAESHCGAQGLMQLMPETARQMGVQNPFDIGQNIDGGSRYLRQMLDRFDGNVKFALAAYNAGPGRVEQYGGIPPIQETEQYVPAVLAHYENFNGSPEILIPMGADLHPDLLAKVMLETNVRTEAILSTAIATSSPLSLKLPERRRDDPPPPPPPGVRV